MVKLNFSNFEKLEDTEKEHAKKTIDAFIEKMGSRIPDMETLNVSLNEQRRRDGVYGVSEISVHISGKGGQVIATANDHNKTRALKQALEKIEKQIRRKTN